MRQATASPSGTFEDCAFDEWMRLDAGRTVRITRLLTHWLWDHGFRLRAYGVEHVPLEGAFLMVPNHSSYLDPFLQVRGQPRIVRYMAKAPLFDMPLVGRFVRAGGAFPVRRGESDGFAMELARRLLADGQPVVMYPEGTRFRTSAELGPPRRGAARLALESGVPVIPVASWGAKERAVHSRPWWRRPRVTVVYGEPLRFDGLEPTPENVDRVRDEIWEQVGRLYERARELDATRG